MGTNRARTAVVGGALAAALAAGCGGDVTGAAPDAAPPVIPAEPEACPPAGAPGRFCDATELAGIDRADWTGPYDGPSGGVAVADFDGDGDLDLFVTGLNIDSALYLNDGAGQFADATAAAQLSGVTRASAAGAADLDNDGDQDLIVSGMQTPVRVFENDGAAVFAPIVVDTTDHNGGTVAVADFDGDSDLDFYVTIWIEGPEGSTQTSPNLLFRNDGDMRFVEIAETAGVDGGKQWFSLAASFIDIDEDGLLDLYVANDFGFWYAPNAALRNQGDGTFAPAAVGAGSDVAIYSMCVSPGDYDNDGDLDIYVTNIGDNVLLENLGSTFDDIAATAGATAYGYRADDEEYRDYVELDPMSDVPEERQFAAFAQQYLHPERELTHVSTGWAALWLDYDQDGWLDLYVCNGTIAIPMIPEGVRQPNVMLRNRGDGTFDDTSELVGVADRGTSRGCATGDLDGDGDLDLVVVNSGLDDVTQGRLRVLRNDAGDGHFARVHVVGTQANRDSVGARVVLRAGGQSWLRVVSGGDGILSHSQRDPHFGLGTIDQVDEISVTWPGGAQLTITDPPIDDTIVITEPAP